MLLQTNGHTADDVSETSKDAKQRSPAAAARCKQHSSKSPSRSKSPIRGQDKKSRHQEGYRDKHRDRSESAPQSRSDLDGKKNRIIRYDPRLDRVSSSAREHERHRSSSHSSKHRHRDDRDYSRERSDRKRRRDDVSPEGKHTYLVSLHGLCFSCLGRLRSMSSTQSQQPGKLMHFPISPAKTIC